MGGSSSAAGRDHLARLFFATDGQSSGAYTPLKTDVRLSGTDRVQDAVVMLHEAHHGALNDSTAWGTALHVVARLGPSHNRCFADLLDVARRTHESYATFASVSITMARHVGAETVLGEYQSYAGLYRSTSRFAADVRGAHRKYLAVTAAARLTMQTPILSTLIDCELLPVAVSELRWLDTPDGRWTWLLRHAGRLVREAAESANEMVELRFGADAVAADEVGDAYDTADDRFDEVWAAWEEHVFDQFARALESAGGSPLAYNGHQQGAGQIVELARRLHPNLDLRADRPQNRAPDDRSMAGAVISQVRHHHAPELWRAARFDLPVEELVEHRTGFLIAGEPTMILDVRLATRLAQLFRWNDNDRNWLHGRRGPEVACRLIGDDDGESVILQSFFGDPAELELLTECWGDRGPVVSVVAASCLVDAGWVAAWLGPLRRIGHQVMLIDTDLDRFVSNWTRDDVDVGVVTVEVGDSSGGTVYAVAIAASNVDLLWLMVGDEVSTTLFVQQLQATPGLRLAMDRSIAERWTSVIRMVVTNILATESFTDLNGLEGYL